MIRSKILNFIKKRRCTLLGVGPMSKNCVDAAIELSNDYEIPIMLIASRRQIEAAQFGGGYANNWSTEEFTEYVIERDKKGKIILSRDHGGLWQNNFEKEGNYSIRKAMETAKKSFQIDIESGFELIHIDTSVDIFGKPSINEVLQRLFELYEFCWRCAEKINRNIIFEIGTEEQSGTTFDPYALEYNLSEVFSFCDKNNLTKPTFVVVQIGTCVKETRNVGSFDSPIRIEGELPAEIQVPKIIEICNKYNLLMKVHNTDYLSDEALIWHPRLGIHAANVAPECGVTETRAFLTVLEENKFYDLKERFVELAYKSRKWEKWMLPDTKASKEEMAIIAGHYQYSDPQYSEIKMLVKNRLNYNGDELDRYLKDAVKKCIIRYLKHFRLIDKL